MYRFFLKTKIEDPQNIIISDKEILHKMNKVLRLKPSDTFILLDATADEYEVMITQINAKQAVCKFLGKTSEDRELDVNICLYQAILKKDKLEWVIQKATEIGVKKIVPVLTEHCVAKDFSDNKLSRYQKIIEEATLQCGGKTPLLLEPVMTYEQAVRQLGSGDLNLIAFEQEKNIFLKDLLKQSSQRNVNLFIGPEGGFSDEEIKLAMRNSLQPFSLGKRILRAETAAICGCALIANLKL